MAVKQSKNNNSTGPDKINIIKHIGWHGLAYLTNNNIISHSWKLTNIILIPKPNKDMNIGTLPTDPSHFSSDSKTFEKTLLTYITNNIPHNSTQHGKKQQPHRADKVNILKHIGPLGLAYLTNIYNISINNNIISHSWKLANIIPIPKPNKDMNIGNTIHTHLISLSDHKTLEKTLHPYITNNNPHIFTQHGFKSKHSTSTT